MLIEYCTIKSYCSYLKLFKSSLLIGNMTIFLQVILVLTKLQSSLVSNTICQILEKVLKLISNTAMFV